MPAFRRTARAPVTPDAASDSLRTPSTTGRSRFCDVGRLDLVRSRCPADSLAGCVGGREGGERCGNGEDGKLLPAQNQFLSIVSIILRAPPGYWTESGLTSCGGEWPFAPGNCGVTVQRPGPGSCGLARGLRPQARQGGSSGAALGPPPHLSGGRSACGPLRIPGAFFLNEWIWICDYLLRRCVRGVVALGTNPKDPQ
jgi:hypothetical protein